MGVMALNSRHVPHHHHRQTHSGRRLSVTAPLQPENRSATASILGPQRYSDMALAQEESRLCSVAQEEAQSQSSSRPTQYGHHTLEIPHIAPDSLHFEQCRLLLSAQLQIMQQVSIARGVARPHRTFGFCQHDALDDFCRSQQRLHPVAPS